MLKVLIFSLIHAVGVPISLTTPLSPQSYLKINQLPSNQPGPPNEIIIEPLSHRSSREQTETDAQWGADVRLTNNSVEDHNGGGGQRQVVVDPSGRVHVVWVSGRSPGTYSPQIYYCRFNPGSGWTRDTCISADVADIGYSSNPAICVDSAGDIHLVWCVEVCTPPEGWFIAYKMCTPTGAGNGGWELTTTRITEDTLYKETPDINTSPDGRVHIIYAYSYFTPPPSLLVSALGYKEKIGTTWQDPVMVISEAHPWKLVSPRVAADRYNNIHLTWSKRRESPPYYSMIGYRGRFSGIWGTLKENINGDVAGNYSHPSTAVNPQTNHLHIVWTGELPYSRIIHKERLGTYADDTFQLTGDTVSQNDLPQNAPCIAFSIDGKAHVVWEGYNTPGYRQIYYNIRSDSGTWGVPAQLTSINSSDRGRPALNTGGTGTNTNDLHLIWSDERDGNPEIYYKHFGPVDVGVTTITAPVGRIRTGQPVIPQAKVKNFASGTRTFMVKFTIGSVYSSTKLVTNLPPNSYATVFFEPWTPATPGEFTTCCVTLLFNDEEPGNDTATGSVEVYVPEQPGWTEKAHLPGPAKDGAFLVFNPDNGLIYAARGYRSGDFYSYNPKVNTWMPLTFWPAGTENKLPYTGACACYGDGYIWTIKGNKTGGFWRYSIETGQWEQLPDVPPGPSGKPVKGGADAVYVDRYVYLLKGGNQEFYRYNTTTNIWESLSPAPAVTRSKWTKGSWLVYDGADKLFAHKAKYCEMWAFDLTTQKWEETSLPGIPQISGKTGKRKKSKDGSDATFYNGFIYTLKGGNTCEWWQCCVGNNTCNWIELDPMPELGMSGKRKGVRGGGAVVSTNDGSFYALKGGKSGEFWRYAQPEAISPPGQSKVMEQPVTTSPFDFNILPNPVTKGYTALFFTVPKRSVARVQIYDITGRRVMEFTFEPSGTGKKIVNLRDLAAGVYLVNFKTTGFAKEKNLIVR